MRMRTFTVLFFTAAALLLSTIRTAQAKEVHNIAITISPLHVVLPVLELTSEFAVARDVGVAATLGAGTYDDALFLEVGGQYNYYLIGYFDHGVQLGAELMYMYLESGAVYPLRYIAEDFAQGLVVGPHIGYKFAADYGLTFNVQAGVSVLFPKARMEHLLDGAVSALAYGELGPRIKLNVGWSF